MQDCNGIITVEEEHKQFLLRCVQEQRKIYPDCRKQFLKINNIILWIILNSNML